MKMHGSKGHRYTAAMNMVAVALAISTLVAGMTGCATRPAVNAIEIRTWYDLAAIGNNMSSNYVLMNDLDASTDGYEELAGPTANGGQGWKPIVGVNESQPDYFTGVFDGQGHKIKDLFINRPDGFRVGLFPMISLSGVIRNVGLVNATVTGGQRVGALAGQIAFSTVSNCYATGTVNGSDSVGGLVGGIWNAGVVSNCYATGTVNGGNFAGGLVGYINDGTVTGSYYTGSVTGGGQVGGLVGDIEDGTVTDSYSTGNVAGYGVVGGLLGSGDDDSTVTNCYATGNVTGEGYGFVGGLVGSTDGNVSDCYATGSVVGSMEVGGLAGIAQNVSNCYATGNVTGTGDGAVGGLVGWHTEGTVSNCYATGNVAGNYSGGLVGVNGHNWLSFGPMALGIDDTVAVYYSYSTGSVTGGICVGGLVGENYLSTAVVGYSYSTASATGNNMTGGLVGWNAGDVTDCYATGSVAGNHSSGGLVGYNRWGKIAYSYSAGSVVGNYSAGGLVGGNYTGTVTNSFWDTQTSGQNTSTAGTGKNTTQMKDVATFSGAAWNIITVANSGMRNPAYIWNIVDAVTYPFLNWQPA